MERIGVIGLGRMGSAIAARYAQSGADVTGWTRSGMSVERAADLGITIAPSIADLVTRSDVILTSLFDDAAVAIVLDTLLGADLGGKLIVETSTVVPSVITDRASAFAAKRATLVDAPISGGPELVLAGACGIFVGATPEDATRALAALEPLTERRRHVGPLGAGLTMKSINNSMVQVYMAGLAEQLRVAKRGGLALETVLTLLSGGPAGLPIIRDRIPKILGQDDSVGFTVTGMHKDNAVFRSVAAELGVETPTLNCVLPWFEAAIEAGMSEQDGAVIFANAYRDDG